MKLADNALQYKQAVKQMVATLAGESNRIRTIVHTPLFINSVEFPELPTESLYEMKYWERCRSVDKKFLTIFVVSIS
jgi:hypothetical protein